MDWLIISLVVLPPALWLLSHGLFWCFCWCFCTVENYFQDRFMRKIMKNMERLEGISEREAA
jgi:hypothetical protein